MFYICSIIKFSSIFFLLDLPKMKEIGGKNV